MADCRGEEIRADPVCEEPLSLLLGFAGVDGEVLAFLDKPALEELLWAV
jgi:hypothetical protein